MFAGVVKILPLTPRMLLASWVLCGRFLRRAYFFCGREPNDCSPAGISFSRRSIAIHSDAAGCRGQLRGTWEEAAGSVSRVGWAFGVTLASLLFALGCGPVEGDDARTTVPEVVRRDSAGIEVIDNAGPICADGEAQWVSARPLFDIGGSDVGSDSIFLNPMATALPNGAVAVADSETREVRVFDAQGQLVVRFGGLGEGPGEFGDISALDHRGDTIFVSDGRRGRLTRFSASGELISSTRFPPDIAGAAYRGWTRGGVVFSLLGQRQSAAYGSQTISVVPAQVVQVTSDGERYEDLFTYWDRGGGATQSDDSRLVANPLLLYFRGTVIGLPDAIVAGFGGFPEYRLYDLRGRLIRIVRAEGLDVLPHLAADRLRQSYDSASEDPTRSPVMGRLIAGWVDQDIPLGWPRFERIFVDPFGYVWLAPFHPLASAMAAPPPQAWSVFSPEGLWLCNVALPGNLHVLDIDRDVVVGFYNDSWENQHIVAYAITRGL